MPEHTIEALCQRSAQISRDKGWVTDTDPRPFSTAVALMHSELSEALEDYRKHKTLSERYYEAMDKGPDKPCGIDIELADLVIRICQRMGTDGNGPEFHIQVKGILETSNDLGGEQDFGEFLAERHFELSKAYEHQNEPLHWLADVVAATFAYCNHNNVDLWHAIDEKEAFNRTRPDRHGGKKC